MQIQCKKHTEKYKITVKTTHILPSMYNICSHLLHFHIYVYLFILKLFYKIGHSIYNVLCPVTFTLNSTLVIRYFSHEK